MGREPREWPPVALAEGAGRSRITGSHIYAFLDCEHRVWLEFYGDRDRRLPPSAALESLLARGRDHEARILVGLEAAEPQWPEGDWAAGARATLGLLREGVPLVSQGVLYEEPWLGIPDLLRRVEVPSRLGAWSYEVGDIKSSYTSRADQALQVTFYSVLLGRLQGRLPERGFLILRDGSERGFAIDALQPSLDEVLDELVALLSPGSTSRPHRDLSCRSCGWREVCAEGEALDWLPGMSRAERVLLAGQGLSGLDGLRRLDPKAMARGGLLPEATWERIRVQAEAVHVGRAVPRRRPRLGAATGRGTPVLVLRDPFDRLDLGWASLAPDGALRMHLCAEEAQRAGAFAAWLADLDGGGPPCHAGGLREPLLEAGARFGHETRAQQLHRASVDVLHAARGALAFPAPVRRATEALAWLEGREPAQEDLWEPLLHARDLEGLAAEAERELVAIAALQRRLAEEAA